MVAIILSKKLAIVPFLPIYTYRNTCKVRNHKDRWAIVSLLARCLGTFLYELVYTLLFLLPHQRNPRREKKRRRKQTQGKVSTVGTKEAFANLSQLITFSSPFTTLYIRLCSYPVSHHLNLSLNKIYLESVLHFPSFLRKKWLK
jgi:hypothetical protein